MHHDVYSLCLILLPTDYTMKCCVIHNSTGVCVIKKKLKISPRLGAPLGFVQFDTDITNLSLQVSQPLYGGNTGVHA